MYVLVLGDVELYMVCRDPGVKCVNIMLYKVVILFTAYTCTCRMVEEDIISISTHNLLERGRPSSICDAKGHIIVYI